MSERDDIEGKPRETGEREAGEDVPREARSVEGIPASAQGDGEGDDLARDGALRTPHKVNPEIGEVGA